MKSLKIMGIIGLGIAGLSWLCMSIFSNPTDYEASIGWGCIAMLYLIALSIMAIIKSKHL